MEISWYLPFTKVFFMNICIIYTYFRMQNKKVNSIKHVFMLLCFNIFMTVIYCFLKNNLKKPFIYLIYYSIFMISFFIIMKERKPYAFTLISISMSISLLSICISTSIAFIIFKMLRFSLDSEKLVEYVVIGTIQFSLIFLFFRIKRFKDGLQFLNGSNYNNILNYMGIGISAATIVTCGIYGLHSDYSLKTFLLILLIAGGILMIYWIKKSITKYYKEKMKERTVEIQQEQIKQQDEKIKNLQTELADVLQINHKYSHRISAMEKAVTKLGTKLQANEEFAEEYGDILSSIKKLSKEYKEEVASVIKETKLPKTNIFSIDNLLEYMKQESEKDKIDFKLNLDFDINEILETKIPQSKLETMLADHIRDAIIAINCSENKERKIKVVLDKEDNNYQIKFYDTGIEFEIETLSKLGLKRTTTHKSTGGSGIGFMTTFETLKQCKASLIIEEYSDLEYTKAVIIKFDNKNEYRIHSYRAEEIKNKIKDNRIIIE